MKIRILLLTMLPVICLAQINSNGEKPSGELLSKEISPNEMKRNASFNVEEIKVRWKKAALENCTGVPCVAAPSFTCGTSTISDIDGNVYETVSIGTQCWTKTNLKVTMYNDGVTPIPDLTSGAGCTTATTGARTEYVASGVTGYVSNYGYLYNWYAAAGIITNGGSPTKNICPTGWHVSTDSEWTTLTNFLNSVVPTGNVGGKMKSTSSLWNAPNTYATNSSGFSVLPGGYRDGVGSFGSVTANAYFWSAAEVGSLSAWYRSLFFNDGNVNRLSGSGSERVGFSVRCLKD